VRLEKAESLLQLALEMTASHTGMSLADIEQHFAVGRRTAQRMRDAVARAFPQIEEIRLDDRTKRWRIPACRTIGKLVGITAADLAALEVAADVLERDGRQDLAQAVKGIQSRTKALLSPDDTRRIEPDLELLAEAEEVAQHPGPRAKVDRELLSRIRAAIVVCRQIRLRYRRRYETEERERLVQPYGLIYGHRHYLLAFDPEDGETKTYSLPNISGVEDGGANFVRDPSFSLRDYAERSFGVFQEPPFDVLWRFLPQAADDARAYVFHPKQVTEDREDGSLLVRFRSGGLLEMAWHLYQWGDCVEVIEPSELREIHERTAQKWRGRP
jgi:predicted DNA-binding transcriptional regulator YafY